MFSVLRKISAFAGSRRGLLKKSMLVAFLGAVFTAFQFWALMLTLEILVGGANLSIWPVIGIMLVSVAGRTACSYWSTNAETETGYFMVAEKRVHIWNADTEFGVDEAVRFQIKSLRKKLTRTRGSYIQTVRGIGYRFDSEKE